MPRPKTAAILGLLVGLVGATLGLTPFAAALDEAIGLRWLFALRGAIAPPPEVVVVALDDYPLRTLKEALEIGDGTACLPRAGGARKGAWPRCLHAHLIDGLTRLGASAIVFDVAFDEPHWPDHDADLAAAIARAKRVALFERLAVEKLSGGRIVKETLLQPIPALRAAAAAAGPFPLPKVPVRVNQFWAFKTSAGGVPTLPVVALQVHALPVLERFLAIVRQAGFEGLGEFPLAQAQPRNADDLRRVMRVLRRAFRENSRLYARFLDALAAEEKKGLGPDELKLLAGLASVYSGDDDYHLNFYGPPGTIRTIPGAAILARRDTSAAEHDPNLEGTVVFVGATDLAKAEQDDGFYTVFSREDGVDLSGVEILATAFANLLTDRALVRLSNLTTFCVLAVFGGVAGAMAFLFPGLRALATALVLGGAYFWSTQFLFDKHDLWTPIVVPLLGQLPAALLLGLTLQYLMAKRLGENVARAIRYYVPERVAEALAQGDEPAASTEVVFGTLLSTDAQNYTSVSEKLDPEKLAALMNEYYEAITALVERNKGTILEFVADSTMSVWIAQSSDRKMRQHACSAALEIQQAVALFNQRHEDQRLPTRIGLHAGRVAMGNVGGGGHYAYSLTGDIANTTSRIESLNKHLGTWVLASASVVADLDGLLVRRVGSFRLKGKTTPLTIFEILGESGDACTAHHVLYRDFEAALRAFECENWSEAAERFAALASVHPEDGPTRFYVELARRYAAAPPSSGEGASIRMETK